jgi:hypothetical protein
MNAPGSVDRHSALDRTGSPRVRELLASRTVATS